MVRAYIYNVIVINKHNFADYIKALENFPQKLTKLRLKVNPIKLFFGWTENEHLVLWVRKNWVRPQPTKLDAITSVEDPTAVCNVRWFLGIVSYYRGVWHKPVYTLSPLAKLCSTKIKFKCTGLEQNAFMINWWNNK